MAHDSTLDNDELLCLEHDQYVRQVNDSGVPLWMLDMYQLSLLYEEVDNSARHETDTDHITHAG